MRLLPTIAVLTLLSVAPAVRANTARDLPLGASDVTADALHGLRSTHIGAPLAHALEACGVSVVRQAMPPKLSGLWLADWRVIVLAERLDAVEARIVLGHEATHASRTCLGRTPPMPAHAAGREAWIDAMLDEETDAILAATALARELAEGDAAADVAVGRHPLTLKAFALEAQGLEPEQLRAAMRAQVGQESYRRYYEAIFALSGARN
ncbi:hypothetical protein [Azospirillum sp. sgz301742]